MKDGLIQVSYHSLPSLKTPAVAPPQAIVYGRLPV